MADTPARLDKRKIKIAAQGAAERRRHQRVPLALPGRLFEHGRGEQRCRLIDVSPGGAKLLLKEPPPPNSHVVLLIDGLGRLEGDVIRIGGNWLTLRFTMQSRKRDRLADAITWRFNMERLVRVGKMTGRVARILERGFAVAFDPPSSGSEEAKPEPGAAIDLRAAS